MAGQTTIPAREARIIAESRSSADPWAIRAMVLAVAGATRMRSDFFASEI